MQEKSGRADLLPSLGIIIGGALWGIYWLPLRFIDDFGLGPGWAGGAVYALVLLVLLPFALMQRRVLTAGGFGLLLTGMLTGSAFALYAAAMVLTEVLRVLLLFYLTPVWSTLLGRLLLGERFTWNRLLALLFGFAGLLVVLGLGAQFPWPRNLGDWLALGAGMLWAYGTLRVFRGGQTDTFPQIFVFVLGGTLVSVVFVALFYDVVGPWPQPENVVGLGLWLALAALMSLPMIALIIWPATVLSPGRVGILLMGEIVVGVSSAALLAGEPFGTRELLGTLLILAAGVVEVLPSLAKGGATAPD